MAGSAQGIRAGRAFVEIGAVDRTGRILNNIAGRLKGFGRQLQMLGGGLIAAGAAIVGPLAAASLHFAKTGDELQKMSARTSISVEELSRLKFAAEQSGTELGTVENGIRRMQANFFDLGRGLSTATDSFGELGLAASDLEGKTTEEQFRTIAKRLGQVEDKSLQAALAQKIFGRSGTALVPLLKNLDDLRNESDALNLTMTQAEADGAARFTDAMHRLWSIAKRVAFVIGGAVANSLSGILERLAPLLSNVINFTQRNQEMIATLFKIGLVTVLVGAGIFALGTLAIFAGAAFSGAATLISGGATLITTTLAIAKTAALLFWAALTSPAVIAAAAVAVVVGLLLHASGALSGLGSSFGEIGGIFQQTWQGILSALKSGNLEQAGTIALSGLKAVWFEVLADLKTRWAEFKLFLIEAFAGAAQEIMKVFRKLQAGIANTIIELSTNDGLIGKGFSAITGVDGAAQQKRSEELNRRLAAKGLATGDDFRTGAKKSIDAQARQDLEGIERETADFLATVREDLERERQAARAQADAARDQLTQQAAQADAVVADKAKEAEKAVTGGSGNPAKALTTTLPEALERGSIAAARKAFENRQRQLQSEQLAETKTTNDKLDELPGQIVEGLGGLLGAV